MKTLAKDRGSPGDPCTPLWLVAVINVVTSSNVSVSGPTETVEYSTAGRPGNDAYTDRRRYGRSSKTTIRFRNLPAGTLPEVEFSESGGLSIRNQVDTGRRIVYQPPQEDVQYVIRSEGESITPSHSYRSYPPLYQELHQGPSRQVVIEHQPQRQTPHIQGRPVHNITGQGQSRQNVVIQGQNLVLQGHGQSQHQQQFIQGQGHPQQQQQQFIQGQVQPQHQYIQGQGRPQHQFINGSLPFAQEQGPSPQAVMQNLASQAIGPCSAALRQLNMQDPAFAGLVPPGSNQGRAHFVATGPSTLRGQLAEMFVRDPAMIKKFCDQVRSNFHGADNLSFAMLTDRNIIRMFLENQPPQWDEEVKQRLAGMYTHYNPVQAPGSNISSTNLYHLLLDEVKRA